MHWRGLCGWHEIWRGINVALNGEEGCNGVDWLGSGRLGKNGARACGWIVRQEWLVKFGRVGRGIRWLVGWNGKRNCSNGWRKDDDVVIVVCRVKFRMFLSVPMYSFVCLLVCLYICLCVCVIICKSV